MATKTGHDTLEKVDIITEEPGYYNVIFFNDEVTPMDFVIEVLQKIFKHDLVKSQHLMLTVHNDGSAVVGVYPYEIAEQKSVETTMLARNNGFPLQVKIQKE
jgi:ATP-dependent Clp protease adaptor protein ClpS